MQADRVCPSGWVKLVSSCYYFSTYLTTWFKARSACQKFGGDLTVPMNNKENYAIWNVEKQKSLTHPFIGLVRHSDTKFYTVEGVKPSYTNWAPGQPSSPNSERCGHFHFHFNGKWNDIPCSNSFNFICQQPLKCKYKHTNIISLEANVNLCIIYICAMCIDLILYYISLYLYADNLICNENQMKVFIYKPLLKVSSASQLQLLHRSCKPQESKFYYVFTTSLAECGTIMTSDNNGKTVSFHNKVVESLSAFNKSISRSKEIHFPFKCSYPKSYLVSSLTFGLLDFANTSKNASSEGKISLLMRLYKDQSFSKPLVGDPSLNERLYVEIGLNITNSSSEKTILGIELNECYVTSKSSLAEHKYILIERG